MASLASGEPATVGPCKFFASGSCKLGARCKYVHDVKNMAVADVHIRVLKNHVRKQVSSSHAAVVFEITTETASRPQDMFPPLCGHVGEWLTFQRASGDCWFVGCGRINTPSGHCRRGDKYLHVRRAGHEGEGKVSK